MGVLVILDRVKKATGIIDFFSSYKKRPVVKIADYLDKENIAFLESKNKNGVLLQLVNILHNSKKLKEKNQFYKKILEREKIVPTGIGMGVAVPHAKIKDNNNFFIALGVIKSCPINWTSIDNLPIRMVFMIGGPENKNHEYLELLSQLTIVIKDDVLRKNILKASNKQEICKLFHHF